ncbi:hypothetical protein E2C01_080362 [Portunus trituberculatus]|uniref:Uncharacterized protein n=1 Tax=Portunus trituberculatus TaxID=210409 RepID=A0A5B7IJI3_PORTR|nr:hypothetical protein [Portunus trituberculatus]
MNARPVCGVTERRRSSLTVSHNALIIPSSSLKPSSLHALPHLLTSPLPIRSSTFLRHTWLLSLIPQVRCLPCRVR